MKRQLVMWPVALALSAMALFAQGTKVGVVNIQSALVATKDGQKAASELEGRRAPKQKDLERKQAEIRSLQESLNRGGNAMSEQAKAELVRNIDVKTKSFNRELEDNQAEWDGEQQKVLQELGQKMMAVIDKYSKDNGYSVILDVSNPQTPVLYASSAIDITKDIVDLYDKAAAMAPPAPAASGAAAPSTRPAAPAAKPPVPAPVKK